MKKQALVRIVLVGMAALLLQACGTTPATPVGSHAAAPAKSHATVSGSILALDMFWSEENYLILRSQMTPEDQVKLDAEKKAYLAWHPEFKASYDAKVKALLATHPEWRAQFGGQKKSE